MDLFYTPTELVNGKKDGSKPEIGQRLRIGGMVVAGSVNRDTESLRVSFDLADVGPKVTVFMMVFFQICSVRDKVSLLKAYLWNQLK